MFDSTTENHIFSLPPELIYLIFSFLDVDSAFNMLLVEKAIKAHFNNMKFWKMKIIQDFPWLQIPRIRQYILGSEIKENEIIYDSKLYQLVKIDFQESIKHLDEAVRELFNCVAKNQTEKVLKLKLNFIQLNSYNEYQLSVVDLAALNKNERLLREFYSVGEYSLTSYILAWAIKCRQYQKCQSLMDGFKQSKKLFPESRLASALMMSLETDNKKMTEDLLKILIDESYVKSQVNIYLYTIASFENPNANLSDKNKMNFAGKATNIYEAAIFAQNIDLCRRVNCISIDNLFVAIRTGDLLFIKNFLALDETYQYVLGKFFQNIKVDGNRAEQLIEEGIKTNNLDLIKFLVQDLKLYCHDLMKDIIKSYDSKKSYLSAGKKKFIIAMGVNYQFVSYLGDMSVTGHTCLIHEAIYHKNIPLVQFLLAREVETNYYTSGNLVLDPYFNNKAHDFAMLQLNRELSRLKGDISPKKIITRQKNINNLLTIISLLLKHSIPSWLNEVKKKNMTYQNKIRTFFLSIITSKEACEASRVCLNALYVAVKFNLLEIAEQLLVAKIKPNSDDQENKLIDIAHNAGNDKMKTLLEKYGAISSQKLANKR